VQRPEPVGVRPLKSGHVWPPVSIRKTATPMSVRRIVSSAGHGGVSARFVGATRSTACYWSGLPAHRQF